MSVCLATTELDSIYTLVGLPKTALNITRVLGLSVMSIHLK